MKTPVQIVIRLLLACLIVVAAGCTTTGGPKAKFTDNFKNREALVQIPFRGSFAEVRVSVYTFPANVHANNGVSALQSKEWDTAVNELKLAVAEKPKKASFHLALAVAYEVRGNYAEARTHYLEANRLTGGEGMFDARTGLKRIDARGN